MSYNAHIQEKSWRGVKGARPLGRRQGRLGAREAPQQGKSGRRRSGKDNFVAPGEKWSGGVKRFFYLTIPGDGIIREDKNRRFVAPLPFCSLP